MHRSRRGQRRVDGCGCGRRRGGGIIALILSSPQLPLLCCDASSADGLRFRLDSGYKHRQGVGIGIQFGREEI